MKNKKKTLLIAAVILVLAAAWYLRFSSLNAAFREMYKDNSHEDFGINETVEIDGNYMHYKYPVDNYGILASGIEIFELDDFFAKHGIDKDEYLDLYGIVPDRIAVVTVKIYNSGSDADGIILEDLILHGIDSYSYVDYSLADALNPWLEGAWGVSVTPGSECIVQLPYPLFSFRFSDHTWNALDDYSIWIRLTAYPVEKEIRLQ